MIGTPARPSSNDLPPWLVFSVLAVCWLALLGSMPGALSPTGLPWARYLRGPDMGGGVGGLLGTLRHPVNSYERPVSPTASNPVTERVNLSNGRGDIVAQSDVAGTLTWTASYEAYGKRTLELGSNEDRQRANTKEEDPTGLLNEGFRYRDLETGVWLSRDPAGFVDGPNLYAYVKQNPWSVFDPLGLESEWHHRYPQKHREKFTEMDIDIDAPENGVALDRKDHGRIHKKDGFIPGTGKDQYGKEWDDFFDNLANEEATNGPLDKSARKTRAENFLQELEGQDRFKTALAKGANLPEGMSHSEYSKLTKQQKEAFYKTVWGSKKTGQTVSFAGKAGSGLKFVAKKAGPLGVAVSIVTFGTTASAEGADAASQELLMDLTGASIVKVGADVVEEKLNGVIYQPGGQYSELRRMLEEEEP